ncbi:Wee1-like protein kinase [Trichinella spiralis]|uniref:Wee1-like protein kinase n=1 Tax=Trichinella spiralis TaxID=6334 RepID=A0ABR3K2G9_TRISP
MACNRLAAAVLSASPEMDEPKGKHETKTTSLKWINQSSKYADGLAIHELSRCRIRQRDGYFQTSRSTMKLAEKPLVSKKRSKSNEAPYGILEK